MGEKMEFDTPNERRESKYSGWLLKVERIHILRTTAHANRHYDGRHTWFDALQGWRNEITDRMSAEEDQQCDTFERNALRAMVGKRTEFTNREIPGPWRSIMNEYERFLQRITAEAKLDMPDKAREDSAADA